MPLIPSQGAGFRSIRVKIISNGTPGNMTVVDADTGARLWGVQSVIIQARTGEAPTAIIRVANVEVDLAATVNVVMPAPIAEKVDIDGNGE